jgi:hypothetical protein
MKYKVHEQAEKLLAQKGSKVDFHMSRTIMWCISLFP